jgi:hypothetical protein
MVLPTHLAPGTVTIFFLLIVLVFGVIVSGVLLVIGVRIFVVGEQ